MRLEVDMRTKLAVLLAGLALVGAALPVLAHHAIGAEYDESKVVKLTGVVSKVEWTNPHARVYFDVTQADGSKVTWNVELAARSALVRQGWTANSAKIGDMITVEGNQARSGVSGVHARSVVKSDGKKLFEGDNVQ
jgi:hypothetical protein